MAAPMEQALAKGFSSLRTPHADHESAAETTLATTCTHKGIRLAQ